MRIALDFDSTLFPLLDAMALVPGGERCCYEAADRWDRLAELCDRPLEEVLSGTYELSLMRRVGLYPHAATEVEALRRMGAEVHLVTHRGAAGADAIAELLALEGVQIDQLVFGGDRDKAGYCIESGIDVIVDDDPQVLRAAHERGLLPLSLEHRYLRELSLELGLDLYPDWRQLGGRLRRELATRRLSAAAAGR